MLECIFVCAALAQVSPPGDDRAAMAKEYNRLLGRMRVCDAKTLASTDIVMRVDKVVLGRASHDDLDRLEPLVKTSDKEGQDLQRRSPPDLSCDSVKQQFGLLVQALAGIDPSPETPD